MSERPMAERFARRDYYRILQVDPSAHPEVVRAAYRTLLRVLGKHPDLGGAPSDARTIIEAYGTLSDPERRRTYDDWLKAHGAGATPPPPLAPGIANWIRAVLPEYQLMPKAPFARSFDLVLEGPGALAPRIYVKAFPVVTQSLWPTIFVLCRAVGVARHGLAPSTDVVLVVAREVEALDEFLVQARRNSAPWSWNRLFAAVCTLAPATLHVGRALLLPAALRRLQRSAAVAAEAGRSAPAAESWRS